MTHSVDSSDLVFPGDVIGTTNEYEAGVGCITDENQSNNQTQSNNQSLHIYAAVTGHKRIRTKLDRKAKPTVYIQSINHSTHVPAVGDTVVVRVIRINQRQANCAIMVVNNHAINQSQFTGLIRSRDVRQHEIDTVHINDCFRPGDLVKAEILSLGDARAYLLSTAANHLGVIEAVSDAGAVMVPVSWTEMECPVTKVKELRKLARVE